MTTPSDDADYAAMIAGMTPEQQAALARLHLEISATRRREEEQAARNIAEARDTER